MNFVDLGCLNGAPLDDQVFGAGGFLYDLSADSAIELVLKLAKPDLVPYIPSPRRIIVPRDLTQYAVGRCC